MLLVPEQALGGSLKLQQFELGAAAAAAAAAVPAAGAESARRHAGDQSPARSGAGPQPGQLSVVLPAFHNTQGRGCTVRDDVLLRPGRALSRHVLW